MYNDGLSQPNTNPDNSGPIVRRPMELPTTAGCDTAQDRTRVCSDSSSTEMQCLRPLCHSGGTQQGSRCLSQWHGICVLYVIADVLRYYFFFALSEALVEYMILSIVKAKLKTTQRLSHNTW